MSRTFNPRTLHNQFWLWRHGPSAANEKGIIIATLKNGGESFGLTAAGAELVRENARLAKPLLGGRTIVATSPFLRCRQTAEIICEELRFKAAIIVQDLRERCFGFAEGCKSDHYHKVWARDFENPRHKLCKGESVLEVRKRMRSAVCLLDAEHTGANIVLVSHGDPLQILETAFRGMTPNLHRTLAHLNPAELRKVPEPPVATTGFFFANLYGLFANLYKWCCIDVLIH